MSRSPVRYRADLTNPWLACVWRAFLAQRCRESICGYWWRCMRLPQAAARRPPSWSTGRATPAPLFPLALRERAGSFTGSRPAPGKFGFYPCGLDDGPPREGLRSWPPDGSASW